MPVIAPWSICDGAAGAADSGAGVGFIGMVIAGSDGATAGAGECSACVAAGLGKAGAAFLTGAFFFGGGVAGIGMVMPGICIACAAAGAPTVANARPPMAASLIVTLNLLKTRRRCESSGLPGRGRRDVGMEIGQRAGQRPLDRLANGELGMRLSKLRRRERGRAGHQALGEPLR
jgi:hypothetical protein